MSRYDAATALVVVDVQNDFADPSGGLYVRDGEQVVPVVNAQLHPGLRVEGPVVRKGTEGEDGYSGFSVRDPVSGSESVTRLGGLLAAAGVRHLVVTGLAGDVCVKATALDGRRLGYEVVVPLAATRFVNLRPGDDALAREELARHGVALAPPG